MIKQLSNKIISKWKRKINTSKTITSHENNRWIKIG